MEFGCFGTGLRKVAKEGKSLMMAAEVCQLPSHANFWIYCATDVKSSMRLKEPQDMKRRQPKNARMTTEQKRRKRQLHMDNVLARAAPGLDGAVVPRGPDMPRSGGPAEPSIGAPPPATADRVRAIVEDLRAGRKLDDTMLAMNLRRAFFRAQRRLAGFNAHFPQHD